MTTAPEDITKELVLALIKKMRTSSKQSPQDLGDRVGEIYKAVYRRVKEALGEPAATPTLHETAKLEDLLDTLAEVALSRKNRHGPNAEN